MSKSVRRAVVSALPLAVVLALAGPATAQETDACEDFHAHANASWLAAHPAGAPASAMGELAARARAQATQLMQGAMAAPQGPLEAWLGDFHAAALDEAAIERAGTGAIAPLLGVVDDVRRARDLAPAIASLHRAGIPVLVDLAPAPAGDALAATFDQGGLVLGDPAFYTREGAEADALRAKYLDHVQRLLELSGVAAGEAAAQAKVVVDIETRIARASRPLSLLRGDPARGRVAVEVAGLDRQYPRLRPAGLLEAAGVGATQVHADPQLLARMDALLGEVDPAQWRSYLRFHVADAMAPHLPKAWRDAHFAFHGPNLRGQLRAPDAAGRAWTAAETLAAPVLGEAYAARYLPPATATGAQSIATAVRDALVAALPRSSSLDAQSRTAAQARLAGLTLAVGTHGNPVDPTGLPALDRGAHAANALAAMAWNQARRWSTLGQPAAADALPPAFTPVLAWQPGANRLVATAAVLQPPVFDAAQPPAAQFGSLGAMLGHELAHAAGVESMAGAGNRLVAQYVGFPIPETPGIAFDSRRIAAEQIADVAGVELALAALASRQPAADAASSQAFARAWAGLWPQRHAPGQVQALASTSAYPPGYWRTNGPLRNQPGFADAFECKAGDAMFVPAEDRVRLWE